MPDECKAVIGYTSYPNEQLGLYSEDHYRNVSMRVWEAAQECREPEKVVQGACHVVYPRCLLGHTLYVCRQTCLGEYSFVPSR
jgi:hypothetical protein